MIYLLQGDNQLTSETIPKKVVILLGRSSINFLESFLIMPTAIAVVVFANVQRTAAGICETANPFQVFVPQLLLYSMF
jgi:hypothetical protein